VFVAKLLQAILPNFSLICLFGLPVLFGLGASSGYTVLYYPLVVIVLAALALAAAGLSSLLVMGVVRLFPARRVAEVLSFAGGIISVLCSQSNYLSRHVSVSEQQTAQTLDMLARLNSPWSPLAWAGRGLVDIGEGRWLSGFLFLGLTLGTAGVIFVIALNTAEQLYYTGWANVQIGTRRKKISVSRPATEKRSAFTTLLERDVPGAVRGIISKDFLMLRRDLRNMSQLVSPLIFGVIYAVLLARSGGEPPQGRGQAPAWFMLAMKNMLVYGNVGISLFVGWSLLSRLALMGFSQEGKHYWLLKTAPVSASKLLIAKFLVAYLPTLILGWGFLLAISLAQGVNLTGLIFGMAVVALCIAGAAGVNLAFGAVGANLDWQDPRQMMPGALGCLGAIASFGYMLVTLGLFFAPPIILAMLGLSEAIGQVIGLAAGGAVSLVCAVIPPLLVRQRVARIGET
jgi:ABC-2 type transport system permease protein